MKVGILQLAFSHFHGILYGYVPFRFPNPDAVQEVSMAHEQPVPVLLSDLQRVECSRIEQSGDTLHGRRAAALLLIDGGATHRETSTKTGLTIGQVRYVLNRFRKLGMAVFPAPAAEKQKAEQPKKRKKKERKKMAKELKKDKKKKDKKEKVKKKDSDSKKKKDKKKKDKKKKK